MTATHAEGGAFGSANHQHSHNIRSLSWALWLTSGFFVVELIAGFLTRSLALLSDAGHMFSDILALVISLYAAFMSRKAPTAQKSYGYYRTEVLAALFNGLILFLMFGFIAWEALHRLYQPVAVNGMGVVVVGSAGLIINLIAARILHDPQDLNAKAAYFHVVLDAFGSVAALIAGIVITLTRWYAVDPILSMVIGVLVLYSSWLLVRDAINILMESVPRHLDPIVIRQHLLQCDGVTNIHDLHVWSIGSHAHALSAHITIPPRTDPHDVRFRVEQLLRDRFHLDHTTLQVEKGEECLDTHE